MVGIYWLNLFYFLLVMLCGMWLVVMCVWVLLMLCCELLKKMLVLKVCRNGFLWWLLRNSVLFRCMFYFCRVWIICLCVGVECVVISVVWIGVLLFVGNIFCSVCRVDRKSWKGLLLSGLWVCLCLWWLKVFMFCLCEMCLFLLLKIIVLLLKVMCNWLVGWLVLIWLVVVVVVLFGGLGRMVVVVMLWCSVLCIDFGLVDRNRLVLNGFIYGQVGLLVVNVVWMMFRL